MRVPVTYLFVPADRPERFAKALASGADRVILDLEDAVRPEAKPAARDAIRAADLDWTRVVVRVNPAGSANWEEDLGTVAACGAVAVMVPKAERAADLAAARERAGGAVVLLPQVETARGLEAVDELLIAPGVNRLVFGHLDFALDLGAATDWEALLLARQRLVWRSRLAGRDAPVDSVTPELDEDAVRDDAKRAARMGFGGKLLIHPRQVAPTAAVFSPSEDDVHWARRVIAAVEGDSRGAVALDGRMIDKPVEDAARRILARANTE